jgi:signal transduction histidine kinase
VFRDVTDMKELDRMKTDFLNTVGHELRTPMTSIRAFSELMAKRDAQPEKVRNWAGIINEETERLGRLIDDLLDVSRIEAGKKMKMNPRAVKLSELAAKVGELFRNVSPLHPFAVEKEPELDKAQMDPDRMLQVISNFVTNAIKYSPQGGPVVFKIKAGRAGQLRFEVSDRGMGLTEKDQAHMFEKFYRVDSSNTQNIRGTGLGLAIAKHIVEMHGGDIGVDSKVGEGSTFWFEIPMSGRSPKEDG